MNIRRATILDISYILALLIKMHEESEFELCEIKPEKMFQSVSNAIENGVVFISVQDGRITGTIGGVYSSDWWSDEVFLGDLWFYVCKECRKSKAGISLIKSFINEGGKMQLRLGHVYGGDMKRKDKFYERLGLLKAGSYYVTEKK
jgi:hypothetical protein|tara:strand:+ start:1671 stop:2108 length:438 start_codon:yes stop_codon:yes gene_type:complete